MIWVQNSVLSIQNGLTWNGIEICHVSIRLKLLSSFSGCGSASARVGAMLTPYIAQVMLRTNLYSAVSVYAVIGILAGINSLFLPTETLGLTLNESGDQVTNGRQEIVDNHEETNQSNQ